MAVSVAGIIMNIVMLIFLVLLIIIAVEYRADLVKCETQQSPFCPQLTCPCDTPAKPCNGFAQRPGKKAGTYYCANAPNTAVDASGNPI